MSTPAPAGQPDTACMMVEQGCVGEGNNQEAAALLEMQLKELQMAISDKDSAIALLEHHLHETTPTTGRGGNAESAAHRIASLKKLKRERSNLTTLLKDKVRERMCLFKRDSEEAIGTLACHHQTSNKRQVCDVLRSLDRDTRKLKATIDRLFAVILDREPSLMEGLPRIQQEAGLTFDLLSAASMTELLEELEVRERGCSSLQEYVDLLTLRITEYDPDYLNYSHDL